MEQILSGIGAVLVLAAFAALQFNRTTASSPPYLAANLVGSALLALVAVLAGLWAYVVLNTVWALVSLRTLIKGRAVGAPPRT